MGNTCNPYPDDGRRLNQMSPILSGFYLNLSVSLPPIFYGRQMPYFTAVFRPFRTYLYIGVCAIALCIPYPTSAAAIPDETPPASSVLFFPGIKGSRLFIEDARKAWEPFGNHDIEALMLDAHGKSIRDDVFTHSWEIILRAAGIADIYGDFHSFMRELLEERVTTEWMPLAYDWRLRLSDVLRSTLDGHYVVSYEHLDHTPFIEEMLHMMSESSPTGKVSIVAHSNGGLVVKELLRKLGDGAAAYIDRIIFVGVPQSGAPQAVAALLYGYKEGLPWWFPGIVSTATARLFAENAPMAYHLLPSEKYFSEHHGDTPVVSFENPTTHATERAAYGSTIDSWDELSAFAAARNNERTKPSMTRIDQANVLNEELLTYAETTHTSLDALHVPDGIQVHQIAGTGRETVSGIRYYERCMRMLCVPLMRPVFSMDGDGVVPTASAIAMQGQSNVFTQTVDLRTSDEGLFPSRSHGNMLGATAIQARIRSILSRDPEPRITTHRMTHSPVQNRHFFFHAPAAVTLVTSEGIPVDARDAYNLERLIPGVIFGDLGIMSYLIAPYESDFEIVLRDIESNTISIEIENVVDAEVVSSGILVGVPINSKAEIKFSSNPNKIVENPEGIESEFELTIIRPDNHDAPHETRRVTVRNPGSVTEEEDDASSGTTDTDDDTGTDPEETLPEVSEEKEFEGDEVGTVHSRTTRGVRGTHGDDDSYLALLRRYLELLTTLLKILQGFHAPTSTLMASIVDS